VQIAPPRTQPVASQKLRVNKDPAVRHLGQPSLDLIFGKVAEQAQFPSRKASGI
jgi:hypothetical protein